MKQPPLTSHSPRFALADLAQDIAGDLPRDLILRWNCSDRDPAFHDELLAPFVVEETIVATDSADLSSLTQRLPLASVLMLVSEPKEILYVLAKSVGGEAIGTWIADNAQSFFPASVKPSAVMDQFFEAQRRIASRTVQVVIRPRSAPPAPRGPMRARTNADSAAIDHRIQLARAAHRRR